MVILTGRVRNVTYIEDTECPGQVVQFFLHDALVTTHLDKPFSLCEEDEATIVGLAQERYFKVFGGYNNTK